ncbi:hypothetical protein PENANT_c005G06556 [Penicillium antarcticum]|uniref:Uncharacterized protein n=1 Tax=Penicillium antarcticum TaxID=416450 RepID=A0A1V6QE40_9EURO|nr:hypothetical protein PENANT_c005G06556 [Penicillium antarcticum]
MGAIKAAIRNPPPDLRRPHNVQPPRFVHMAGIRAILVLVVAHTGALNLKTIFPSKTSFAFFARRRVSERESSAAHFFGTHPSDSDIPSVDVGDGPPSKRILPSILCADVYSSLSTTTTNELDKLISYACEQR